MIKRQTLNQSPAPWSVARVLMYFVGIHALNLPQQTGASLVSHQLAIVITYTLKCPMNLDCLHAGSSNGRVPGPGAPSTYEHVTSESPAVVITHTFKCHLDLEYWGVYRKSRVLILPDAHSPTVDFNCTCILKCRVFTFCKEGHRTLYSDSISRFTFNYDSLELPGSRFSMWIRTDISDSPPLVVPRLRESCMYPLTGPYKY